MTLALATPGLIAALASLSLTFTTALAPG
jgi:hypothetical protein